MMLKSGSEQQAFTLLEVLLVLTILGMAAMLVAPNIGGIDSRSFNAQVREAQALLNHARRTAVVRGMPAQVVFSIGEETSTAEAEAASPADVGRWQARDMVVEFRDSSNQRHEVDSSVEVMFFPEGGSTGGELIMRQGDRVAVISVDPFSGRVSTRHVDDWRR